MRPPPRPPPPPPPPLGWMYAAWANAVAVRGLPARDYNAHCAPPTTEMRKPPP
ncbi:MAG: hypothetical protein IPO58_04885 [Betaproteobacteria bacterium]|nr:hypothetical protein [Betaproteobacteria bacterium]